MALHRQLCRDEENSFAEIQHFHVCLSENNLQFGILYLGMEETCPGEDVGGPYSLLQCKAGYLLILCCLPVLEAYLI